MKLEAIAAALEAILFAAGEPVPAERIAKVLGVDPERVLEAADLLETRLGEQERGGLPVAEPAAKPSLFEYAVQRRPVGSALFPFFQRFADLGVVDEFIRVP